MAEYNGKLADPEFRRERARTAGRARQLPAAHARSLLAHVDELPADIATELFFALSRSLTNRNSKAETTRPR
jgi:hypothetical protein